MKTSALLITLLTVAATFLSFQGQQSLSQADDYTDIMQQYDAWTAKYHPTRQASFDVNRFANWVQNYEFVQQNNAENNGLTLGMNQFADLSLEEFSALHLGRKTTVARKHFRQAQQQAVYSYPQSVDWRSKGVVAPIQNQGVCGSCWAFSAVATLTSLQAISSGNLVEYSEQQLVSCDHQSLGCNGGDETAAMANYTPSAGVETSTTYPYEQLNNARTAACNYNQSEATVVNKGAQLLPTQNPEAIKNQVAQGPISIAINGASIYFQLYQSGVLSNTHCGTNLDHAVNIVGYDTTAETPYYIVRNSWGESWGEQGYVRFAIIDGAGICGCQLEPSYAF